VTEIACSVHIVLALRLPGVTVGYCSILNRCRVSPPSYRDSNFTRASKLL